MKVIKRDMTEADFDRSKIINAINKANNDAMDENPKNEIDRDIINAIVTRISDRCRKRISSVHVEEIQDMVETELMKAGAFEVAKKYIIYRNEHKTQREIRNTIDKPLFELLGGTSTYWNEENSNKNAKLVTTQRDYMAGIVSKDLSERYLLPKDVVEAHREGIIHFHDEDYFAQKTLYNCCLINLDDMLQNGTVISGTQIDKPHSFATACTIATQIIAQVASSQYGFPY